MALCTAVRLGPSVAGLDDVDELQLRWGGVSSNERLSLDSFFMDGWETEELQRPRINGSDLHEQYSDRFGQATVLLQK